MVMVSFLVEGLQKDPLFSLVPFMVLGLVYHIPFAMVDSFMGEPLWFTYSYSIFKKFGLWLSQVSLDLP